MSNSKRDISNVTVAVLSLCLVPFAAGQMDLEDEIRSLARVEDFGLVVDIESALPPGTAGIDNSVWRETLSQELRQLTGRSPRIAIDPTREAHLYVHLNAMSVDGGLVPFSIGASFVQMVQVPGQHQMMAVTWETGLVGLVSTGELPQVLDFGVGIAREFASDLAQARSID